MKGGTQETRESSKSLGEMRKERCPGTDVPLGEGEAVLGIGRGLLPGGMEGWSGNWGSLEQVRHREPGPFGWAAQMQHPSGLFGLI